MRPGRLAVGVALVALSACTASPPVASPTSRSPASSSPPPSPVPSLALLKPLVLRADLTEVPASWARVAFIPFGPGREQLGLEDRIPLKTSVPIVPRSFAFAPDGSIWILDTLKKRLVHYSPAGKFLGDVGGFMNDRFHPHPRDLVFVGTRLYVAQEHHLAATLVPVIDGHLGPARPVAAAGKSVSILWLFADGGNLLAYSGGYSDLAHLGGGPKGYVRLGLAESPEVTQVPGLPVGPRAWMWIDGQGGQGFRVTYRSADATAVRPVRVRVVSGDGGAIHAEVGPDPEVVLPNALASFVMISAARVQDIERYGGGRYYLQVSNDGSPIAWERLPDPGLSDTYQVRHLAVGPDGRMYLMLAEKGGMLILRR